MIQLDSRSAVPPFEQLRSGIAARIRDGRLPAGTRLPPVRRLAKELALAPNTVARAYRELETAGLVLTAGRRGTVVAATGDEVAREAAAAASGYAETMHRLGLGPDEALALARAALLARSPGTDPPTRPQTRPPITDRSAADRTADRAAGD